MSFPKSLPSASALAFALVSLLAPVGAAASPSAPIPPGPPSKGSLDLSAYGFPTTIPELVLLEGLERSTRFDAEARIRADWADSYDRIEVVELPGVQNRYALFESSGRKRIDIAIRGTVNLRNAVFDLEFLKRRSEALGVFLHSGFEKVAGALYADLRPRLKEGYRIRLVGHSLGAAEAIIVGMLLSRDGLALDKVLASAPPKVTDAEGWSRFAGLPVVRLVGPFDPVPFLPPRSLLYGRDPYVQGGKLLLLLDGARFSVLPSSFYDDLPEAARLVFASGGHFDAADHLLPAYLSRLLPKAAGVEYVDPKDWERYARPVGR